MCHLLCENVECCLLSWLGPGEHSHGFFLFLKVGPVHLFPLMNSKCQWDFHKFEEQKMKYVYTYHSVFLDRVWVGTVRWCEYNQTLRVKKRFYISILKSWQQRESAGRGVQLEKNWIQRADRENTLSKSKGQTWNVYLGFFRLHE